MQFLNDNEKKKFILNDEEDRENCPSKCKSIYRSCCERNQELQKHQEFLKYEDKRQKIEEFHALEHWLLQYYKITHDENDYEAVSKIVKKYNQDNNTNISSHRIGKWLGSNGLGFQKGQKRIQKEIKDVYYGIVLKLAYE